MQRPPSLAPRPAASSGRTRDGSALRFGRTPAALAVLHKSSYRGRDLKVGEECVGHKMNAILVAKGDGNFNPNGVDLTYRCLAEN